MNKTLNINLAGLIFHIDENAYQRLDRYLTILKNQFQGIEGGNEIISDIEARIAELFKERTSTSREVITLADVEEVIAIMGKPEDYLDSEDAAHAGHPQMEYIPRSRRIFRDPDQRIIGGVSSGLAAYFNTDPLWIRLLFIVLAFAGPGIIIYLIMWIVIPKASTTAEKLQMRGEHVNVSNIERSIREEMRGVENSARDFTQKAREYDYKRSGRHIGGFFSDLGNFILDAARLIFKFIFKLIGFFFLIIGFIILFALAISLFAGGAELVGSDYTSAHFFEFMHLITENEGHYTLLMLALVLTVIAPLFLLIYFGIRILFNLDPLNSPTKSALAFSTFLGLVLLVIAGSRIGFQLSHESYVQEEVALGEHRTFYLTATDDSLTQQFAEDYDAPWIHTDVIDAFNNVEVDIRQSEDSTAYLIIQREANGTSRREARYHAEKVRYIIDLEDSVISIPVYYILAENEPFRGQEVEVTLYLPPGKAVYIDPSLTEYLYDVKNIQHQWDWEMGDKLWIMTDKGLSCDGCVIPEEEHQDSLEIHIDGDDDIDMDIDQEGINIKYKNETDSGNIRISHVGSGSQGSDSLQILKKSTVITI